MPETHAALREPVAVLVVEDDADFRASVGRALELAGHRVGLFADAESALAAVDGFAPAIVLSDLRLPRADGLQLLDALRARQPGLPVLLMTGHGDIPTAIQAIRHGACDFLEKPFSREQLLAALRRGLERPRPPTGAPLPRPAPDTGAATGIERILGGDSPAVRALRALVLRLAPLSVDVLVAGETGAGKELVARCLHDFSGRRGHFVAVNCAAVPEHLAERELFGSEAGFLDGAQALHIGKIEHAHGGTLFLDEVDALPLPLQAKVLRVLQEREIERLGSNRPLPVDFRIVAATKADLDAMSRAGHFRADLFYRLNVAALQVPALRDRMADIPLLFEGFVREASLRHGLPLPAIGARQHSALLAAGWPGNVRELKACAERLVLGLPLAIPDAAPAAPGPAGHGFEASVASMERTLLTTALRRNGGSVRAASRELRLPLATIYRKLKALQIDHAALKEGDAP